MGTFESLTIALETWFNSGLVDLPAPLRKRVELEFFPMPWDKLSADQRRSVALQLDYQNDPATQQDQQFWWDFFQRVDDLKKQVAEWEGVATPTAADMALKESRMVELNQELSRMETQQRLARGDYFPERKPSQSKEEEPAVEVAPDVQYIAYPKAIKKLTARLGATPEELAAWVWMGPADGGIAAYTNANEMRPPPRFFYAVGSDSYDYIGPLMACWFREDDLDQFQPGDRYITGTALIERWSQQPGLHAIAFIQAKIFESRLLDIHPIYGGTRGTFAEQTDWPPLETGLFAMARIKQIEMEDFDVISQSDVPKPPSVGSSEWRKQTARAAANALHDLPGGSRDKQRQIQAIWASGKYSSRDLCAEQECAALDMSFSAARKALNKTPKPSRC